MSNPILTFPGADLASPKAAALGREPGESEGWLELKESRSLSVPAPAAVTALPSLPGPKGNRKLTRVGLAARELWPLSLGPAGEQLPTQLLLAIDRLTVLCTRRYHACRRWEDLTTVAAFGAAFGAIAAGVYHLPDMAAILGVVTGVLYGMHPVFKFDQRATRYRLLISEVRNLAMRAKNSRVPVRQLVRELNELTRRESMA
jgi:hypothetical protein